MNKKFKSASKRNKKGKKRVKNGEKERRGGGHTPFEEVCQKGGLCSVYECICPRLHRFIGFRVWCFHKAYNKVITYLGYTK